MVHNGFFDKVRDLLLSPGHNEYLRQHGYYDSFDTERRLRFQALHPYIPYSLQDMLDGKMLSGLNAFVASHVSTAAWLLRRNSVTIGRISHRRFSGNLRMLSDYRGYSGEKLDLLIWDSHRIPEGWREFVDANLAPAGVVILVYHNLHEAMEIGFGALGEVLVERGMKSMVFNNPGPHTEIMTAELYYPRENVLNI